MEFYFVVRLKMRMRFKIKGTLTPNLMTYYKYLMSMCNKYNSLIKLCVI